MTRENNTTPPDRDEDARSPHDLSENARLGQGVSDNARHGQDLSEIARSWQGLSENARRWHDMGGLPAGPVDRKEHDFALWEKRVDALYLLCSSKGLFTVDALRRVLEDMGPQAFETQSYYERWVQSINQNLLEAGVYSVDELGRRMQDVATRGETYAEAQTSGG